MDNDIIIDLLTNFELSNDIQVDKIPNIALYMEQVLTFLNENLDQYKVNDDDKLYTKSMINNYVKAGILSKPISKKYKPEQVIELILIFYLKQALSIDDIKVLFDSTLKKDDIKGIYTNCLNYSNKILSHTSEELDEYYKLLDEDSSLNNDTDKLFMLISIIIMKANAYKLFSEKLINKLKCKQEETKKVSDKNDKKQQNRE